MINIAYKYDLKIDLFCNQKEFLIGYGLEIRKKELQKNKVEVRPMICGSMGTQPFYVKKFGELKLPKVSIIDEYGFYVPNHPSLIEEEIEFICDIINKVIDIEENKDSW